MLNYMNVFERTVDNRRNFLHPYCQTSLALYNHVVKLRWEFEKPQRVSVIWFLFLIILISL